MPAYTPKFSSTGFKGGKNILASEHLQFIEGGATLDASAFSTGHHEIGELVARDLSTGKFVPFADGAVGDFDNHGILNIDFDNDGEHDLVVGEVIVRGSVYEAKLASEVPASFKEANPLIRYVTHV